MLKLNGITKTFGYAPALKEINLHLKKGDFAIVIGANGSGKTTLMKVISGEYKPDHGEILIDGIINNCNRHIAEVVQDVNKGTIPEMTLLENMVLSGINGPKMLFYSRYAEKMAAIIKDAGMNLENYLDKPLSSLSGGQRQAIATIMAMLSSPKLLLLDEHTSALDPQMQIILMNYTAKSILEKELTALMITHNINDAIKYGNRLIMLHRGQIMMDIDEHQKSELKAQDLLKLFHKYEDLDLLAGGAA